MNIAKQCRNISLQVQKGELDMFFVTHLDYFLRDLDGETTDLDLFDICS